MKNKIEELKKAEQVLGRNLTKKEKLMFDHFWENESTEFRKEEATGTLWVYKPTEEQKQEIKDLEKLLDEATKEKDLSVAVFKLTMHMNTLIDKTPSGEERNNYCDIQILFLDLLGKMYLVNKK